MWTHVFSVKLLHSVALWDSVHRIHTLKSHRK